MDKARKQTIARACAAGAGAIIIVCVGILLADYIVARVMTPRDDKRHAELQEQIKIDAALAPKLAADQKAVTGRRLARKARATFLAYVLIASGALFLSCVSWLSGQRGRRPVPMARLVPAKPRPAPAARTSLPARPAAPAAGPRVAKPATERLRIGLGACSIARGGETVRAALEREAAEAGVAGAVKVVGCNGMCHLEPMIEVAGPGGRAALYGNVTVDAARSIARSHIRPRRLSTWARWGLQRMASRLERNGQRPDPAAFTVNRHAGYLAGQKRIVLENCGQIDPANIDDYLARDGYGALTMCVQSLTPEEVIAAISASGLRERGLSGSPVGREWELARARPAPGRFLVSDGDQGDARAFAGRLLLESDPHRVLEGLAIAAFATGTSEACVYVRAGRALALGRLREAFRQAEERGFLGLGILGSRFSLRVEVCEAPGAAGDPPAVLSTAETLASVPWIIRHGHQAFAALGTSASSGTKLLSLAGKISRAGLVEVPMGAAIRQVVEEIGGGIKGGRPFKAVQLGGPSGGFIPARLADTPLDHDSLARIGAGLGSGSLAVFDDRDCMVDAARLALRSMPHGPKPELEILDRICKGKGLPEDLDRLEPEAGQAAPGPVATTLRYFRDEYEAHVAGRSCPAGRCRALIRYVVNDNCIGCTLCAQVCPVGAIEYRPYQRHEVAVELCTLCDKCWQACQENAIDIVAAEPRQAGDC